MQLNQLVTMFEPLSVHQGYHQLGKRFLTEVPPSPLNNPYWISGNQTLANQLGLDTNWQQDPRWLQLLAGQQLPETLRPIATVYSGHQFGYYNPQLGDGRALLLGELKDQQGRHWEMQLKGAGQTPFSRQADGRAVLRSTIREYLCSEHIHGLGIPTTRALAMVGSDDPVYRESRETAAILLRMSEGFVRFGHFEFFYHTQQQDALEQLKNYVLERYYPDTLEQADPVLAFFQQVVQRTALMVAHWQAQGWCHGVMNTDNFSILGETIDYGPFGFLDQFDPRYICNHSDEHGRYAYDQQPDIAVWNLARLGQTLTLYSEVDGLQNALSGFREHYHAHYHRLMTAKLGLTQVEDDIAKQLIHGWLTLLHTNSMDYHWSFRRLSEASNKDQKPAIRDHVIDLAGFDQWWQQYCEVVTSDNQRQQIMLKHNPWLILRNWVAQEAIIEAEKKDFTLVNQLITALQNPFDEHSSLQRFHDLPPDWGKRLQLSCSS